MNCKNDNRGGLYRILLIKAEDSSIEQSEDGTFYVNNAEDAVLLPEWLNSNYSFSEEEEYSEQGEMYRVVISGIIPKDKMPDDMELENKGWIAVHQDRMGNVLISGTEEVPLMASITKNTGADVKEANLIRFRLQATEAEKSLPMSEDTFKLYF